MNITLRRFFDTAEHTAGILQVGIHAFSALEDAYNYPKIPGKTRIPAGVYELDLRRVFPMASRYAKRFGTKHKGMIWLKNVPNFDFVYVHIGNEKDDTEGCVLLGRTLDLGAGTVGASTSAYKEFYPLVMNALERDEPVTLTITDQFC